ncbi:hypothetical protein [Streptomyces sp. NPDC001880]
MSVVYLDGARAETDAELHHPVRGGRLPLLTLMPLSLAALLVGDPSIGLGKLLLLHSLKEAQHDETRQTSLPSASLIPPPH